MEGCPSAGGDRRQPDFFFFFHIYKNIFELTPLLQPLFLHSPSSSHLTLWPSLLLHWACRYQLLVTYWYRRPGEATALHLCIPSYSSCCPSSYSRHAGGPDPRWLSLPLLPGPVSGDRRMAQPLHQGRSDSLEPPGRSRRQQQWWWRSPEAQGGCWRMEMKVTFVVAELLTPASRWINILIGMINNLFIGFRCEDVIEDGAGLSGAALHHRAEAAASKNEQPGKGTSGLSLWPGQWLQIWNSPGGHLGYWIWRLNEA